jgi:metal-dependent amidase/aminoacylase/carboxypeptidase family protein
MTAQGFTVTKHYKSNFESDDTPKTMQTAWRAEFTNGNSFASRKARTIGVNSEMDALPIPKGEKSHACGHNLIAVAGVAVALGMRKAFEVHSVSGRIVLLGTPG